MAWLEGDASNAGEAPTKAMYVQNVLRITFPEDKNASNAVKAPTKAEMYVQNVLRTTFPQEKNASNAVKVLEKTFVQDVPIYALFVSKNDLGVKMGYA